MKLNKLCLIAVAVGACYSAGVEALIGEKIDVISMHARAGDFVKFNNAIEDFAATIMSPTIYSQMVLDQLEHPWPLVREARDELLVKYTPEQIEGAKAEARLLIECRKLPLCLPQIRYKKLFDKVKENMSKQ